MAPDPLREAKMDDEKLALEESRRAQQHESVKSEIEGNVQAEIAASANRAFDFMARRRG